MCTQWRTHVPNLQLSQTFLITQYKKHTHTHTSRKYRLMIFWVQESDKSIPPSPFEHAEYIVCVFEDKTAEHGLKQYEKEYHLSKCSVDKSNHTEETGMQSVHLDNSIWIPKRANQKHNLLLIERNKYIHYRPIQRQLGRQKVQSKMQTMAT